MNSNGTTGPISIYLQQANPLLYTLQQDHMTIQPYWIMVLEILAIQLVQRIWNLYRYHEFLLTLEIVVLRLFYMDQIEIVRKWTIRRMQSAYHVALNRIRQDTSIKRRSSLSSLSAIPSQRRSSLAQLIKHDPSMEKYLALEEKANKMARKLKFDLMDVLLYCLPLMGHGIWYCHIQSSCMSAEHATIWNCYNAFGYRLYNYTFVSYCSFLSNFIMKIIVMIVRLHRLRKQYPDGEENGANQNEPKSGFDIHLGFWSCIITFFFNGALILPYLFTHVIPMAFTYIFMSIIYFGVWIILIHLSLLLLNIPLF